MPITFSHIFSQIRVRPRFFDQVGHASSGKGIFSPNHVIVRLNKIMNNLIRTFKVISLC